MISLKEISSPIQEHIDIFNEKFKKSIQSNVPLLDKITRYLVKRKGKLMRPMFVFLSADIFGEIGDKSYRAASLIELLHTATLIHDDVVDDSNERRGLFSINALWKNKIAVLLGDYLLSQGLLLSLDNNDFGLLKIVSSAVREMSEGEILQIEKARRLDIQESVYFEIIKKKTASLIRSCCECGAASVNADTQIKEKMAVFGENVGIAFQIKDDLFDYQKTNSTGKPNGIDIKEQKMTLPLIHMLNNLSYFDKKKVINIVKNHNEDTEKVAEVINMVNNSGGINYAKEKMNFYRDNALAVLKQFPDCQSKDSLEKLVLFTTERNN